MENAEIPDDLRRFILQNIDSVAKLEALLLMRKHAGQDWDPATMSARLYIGLQQATSILQDLSRLSLCRSECSGYRYQPGQALSELVDRLAETYASQLIPVTNLIHARNPSNLQHFADAFKIWKNPKEDS